MAANKASNRFIWNKGDVMTYSSESAWRKSAASKGDRVVKPSNKRKKAYKSAVGGKR